MKVCVVGAGAIGTFLGVHLAKSGWEVSALARGRTLAVVRAAEDAAALGRQDLAGR